MPSALSIQSMTGNDQTGITTMLCRYTNESGVIEGFEVKVSLPNVHHLFRINKDFYISRRING